MHELIGQLSVEKAHIAIVVSRFNETVTRSLHHGALDCAQRSGLTSDRITTVWVPGAFEIPATAKKLARTGKFDAVVTLGAVIRGATAHFEYVAGPAASAIAQVSMETGIPCIFGLLTLDNIQQGLERAGMTCGNKGFEAMQGAIEMINVFRQIEHYYKTKEGERTLANGRALV